MNSAEPMSSSQPWLQSKRLKEHRGKKEKYAKMTREERAHQEWKDKSLGPGWDEFVKKQKEDDDWDHGFLDETYPDETVRLLRKRKEKEVEEDETKKREAKKEDETNKRYKREWRLSQPCAAEGVKEFEHEIDENEQL